VSFPVALRANATTIFVYGGFSKQQLTTILYQIPSGYEPEELKKKYALLDELVRRYHPDLQKNRFIMNTNTGEIKAGFVFNDEEQQCTIDQLVPLLQELELM
jgi:hypothetical protein